MSGRQQVYVGARKRCEEGECNLAKSILQLMENALVALWHPNFASTVCTSKLCRFVILISGLEERRLRREWYVPWLPMTVVIVRILVDVNSNVCHSAFKIYRHKIWSKFLISWLQLHFKVRSDSLCVLVFSCLYDVLHHSFVLLVSSFYLPPNFS